MLSIAISESAILYSCLYARKECPNENVQFFLYTRETQESPVILDLSKPKSVLNAGYKNDRPLIVGIIS